MEFLPAPERPVTRTRLSFLPGEGADGGADGSWGEGAHALGDAAAGGFQRQGSAFRGGGGGRVDGDQRQVEFRVEFGFRQADGLHAEADDEA